MRSLESISLKDNNCLGIFLGRENETRVSIRLNFKRQNRNYIKYYNILKYDYDTFNESERERERERNFLVFIALRMEWKTLMVRTRLLAISKVRSGLHES